MDVATFAELEQEFYDRVVRTAWCSVATVDSRSRPRSRILHPVWQGATGWIATRPTSHKAKHLAANPYVSLAYVADIAKPVYVDARAEWVDDADTKRRVWDVIATAPQPMGYDPAPIFQSPDSDKFGVLKLTPWRIEVYNFPASTLVWRADA